MSAQRGHFERQETDVTTPPPYMMDDSPEEFARVTGRFPPNAGAALIAAERHRQVEQEGWTPEHDAEHSSDDLVYAAISYAIPADHRAPLIGPPWQWPWHARFWKPSPDKRVRELVKAGALIAAEIDRLQAQALARADHGITS